VCTEGRHRVHGLYVGLTNTVIITTPLNMFVYNAIRDIRTALPLSIVRAATFVRPDHYVPSKCLTS
jgi:hypothetical protein